MPPYRHRPESCSDGSDRPLSQMVDPVGFSPTRSPAASNRHYNQHSQVVLTNHEVKKKSAQLGGFSDWRTSGGGGGDKHDGGSENYKWEPPSSRQRSSRHRKYQQIHSCSFNSSSGSRSGTGNDGLRSSFNSDSNTSSNNRNVKDMESDILAKSPASLPARSSKQSGRDEPKDLGRSDPTLTSCTTEKTTRCNNTTQATLMKYKQLYEAMLNDAGKDEDAAWTGLGNGKEEGDDAIIKVDKNSFHSNGSSNENSALVKVERKERGEQKSSLRSRDSNNDAPERDRLGKKKAKGSSFHSSSNKGDGRRRQDKAHSFHSTSTRMASSMVKPGATKESSFYGSITTGVGGKQEGRESSFLSIDTDGGSSATRPRDGKMMKEVPNTPTAMLLADEMIEDLQVSPLLIQDAVSPSSPSATDNSAQKDPPVRSSGERAIMPRIQSSRRLDKSESGVKDAPVESSDGRAVVARSRSRRSDKSDNGVGRRSSGPRDSDGGKNEYHRRHRESGRDRPPSVERRESGRDLSRSASVDSRRSNEGDRSDRGSPSESRSGRRSGSRDDPSGRAGATAASNDKVKPKKGLFGKIKKLAGRVKDTLGELGGGAHKYRLGELARYMIVNVPRCLRTYDVNTRTVEVEITAVHIDAVLEMPYYTVRLPDGTSKQTNWDNLMTLSEYRRWLAALADSQDNDDPRGEDSKRSSRRFRSLSRSRSLLRGRSSSRRTEREGSSGRRGSRGRFSSRGSHGGEDDGESASSRDTSRSSACRESSRSGPPRLSPLEGGRPRSRSPSPFSKREAEDRPRSEDGRRSSRSKPGDPSPARAPKNPNARLTRKDARAPSNGARAGFRSENALHASAKSFSGEDAEEERRRGPADRSNRRRHPSRALGSELESSARTGASLGEVIREENF